MTIREYFYLLFPTVLLYLVSLLITFIFVKKNKFLYFCIINWLLCTISYIFFFGEMFEDIRMSPSDYSDRMFNISEGFPLIMLDPLHHLLFLIAVFLLIRKIFIKNKKAALYRTAFHFLCLFLDKTYFFSLSFLK